MNLFATVLTYPAPTSLMLIFTQLSFVIPKSVIGSPCSQQTPSAFCLAYSFTTAGSMAHLVLAHTRTFTSCQAVT